MTLQRYCDVYKWTILKPTSSEVKCLHPTSSRRKMCTSSVSNVIYDKFSHGTAFYTLNGKNVNVMVEFTFKVPKKLAEFANSADHKEVAHHKPPHLITVFTIPSLNFDYNLDVPFQKFCRHNFCWKAFLAL